MYVDKMTTELWLITDRTDKRLVYINTGDNNHVRSVPTTKGEVTDGVQPLGVV